jgi:hypothetical protein
MADIVERLRGKFLTRKEDCLEAADEIERLRNLCAEMGISSKKPMRKDINMAFNDKYYEFLSVYEHHKDLIGDEAASHLGIPEGEYGWWSTVSQLKLNGYIEWTGDKRKSRRNGSCEVYKITDKGLTTLKGVRGD